jgi:hypothetical protein
MLQANSVALVTTSAPKVIMRGAADSSASLVGGLVSMARGIGTTFGISLMALAWHLGSQSYQVGNPGYSGSEQARPAFAVLAVVAATAATIALASRAGAGPAERPREGSPSGADHGGTPSATGWPGAGRPR